MAFISKKKTVDTSGWISFSGCLPADDNDDVFLKVY